MANEDENGKPSNREIYEYAISGAQFRPLIPPLRADSHLHNPVPRNLEEFRIQEGSAERNRRLLKVWNQLPKPSSHRGPDHDPKSPPAAIPLSDLRGLTPQRAAKLNEIYDDELRGRCGGHGSSSHPVGWKAFKAYAEAKEAGTHMSSPSASLNLRCYPRVMVRISRRT
jgi:solute carrier family 25 phosphate transporter 23/24/25/41